MQASSRALAYRLFAGLLAVCPLYSACSLRDPAFDEFSQPISAGSGGSLAGGGTGGLDVNTSGSPLGGADAAGTGGLAIPDGGMGGVPESMAGDAGAANGGTAGGGSAGSGGDPNCVTYNTELCDGFESGKIDPALWSVLPTSDGATLTVDKSRVHRGNYAVHITGVAGKHNTAQLQERVTFPAKFNSFYVRAFVYFAPDLPLSQTDLYAIGYLVGGGKNAFGEVETGLGTNGGSAQFLGYSIFHGPPFYQFGPWSSTRATSNTWMCLELHEDGSKTDTESRQVWLNDQEMTELKTDSKTVAGANNANHTSPAYTFINVGLGEFTATPTLTDMWVDDVRVSSAKIGCKL